MPTADDPLLSLDDVAELLHRSPRTVRRLRQKNLLREVRLGGSVWIRRSELDRALGGEPAENTTESAR
jgi:excisionase family DNA binding protein